MTCNCGSFCACLVTGLPFQCAVFLTSVSSVLSICSYGLLIFLYRTLNVRFFVLCILVDMLYFSRQIPLFPLFSLLGLAALYCRVVLNAISMSMFSNSFMIFPVSGPQNVMRMANVYFCVPYELLVETLFLFCFGCIIC